MTSRNQIFGEEFLVTLEKDSSFYFDQTLTLVKLTTKNLIFLNEVKNFKYSKSQKQNDLDKRVKTI